MATIVPTTATPAAARHRRPVLHKDSGLWKVNVVTKSNDQGLSSRRGEATMDNHRNDGDSGVDSTVPTQRPRRSASLCRLSSCHGTRRLRTQRRHRRRIVASSAVIMGTLYLLIHLVGLTFFFGSGVVPPKNHSLDYEKDCLFFSQDHQTNRLPILIVGGTDGSGTRAVVDTLGSLGVTVVADDDQTLDIHASTLFRKQGWPALVTKFLSATGGSLTDEFDTLPTVTQQIIMREMHSLQIYIARKYANENRRNRQRPDLFRHFRKSSSTSSRDEDDSNIAHASKVAFVIKAPATLLVLPLLWKFFKPIRFIHVVRDGRDIALSDNQSPVLKFYNVTYPHDYEQRSQLYSGDLYPVRAMQLWNDWNLQIQHWASIKATLANRTKNYEASASASASASSSSFDYMLLRTEDLVDSSSTKFNALTRLADFVGSSLTSHQLCCLAKAPPRDYGQSNIHSEKINNHIIMHDQRDGHDRGGHRTKSRAASDDAHWSHEQPPIFDANRLAMEIQEKEAELERLHAQLNQVGGSRRQDQRRLLSEIPKMVPTLFLKQLAAWQDRVHLSAGDYRTETLYKLLDYGHSLFTQYMNNRQALEYEVSPKEIQDTLDHLRKLLENRGVSPDNPRKNKQQMMHQSIHSRYGKWKEKLSNKTQLSQLLHQEGKDGLSSFGYEPRKEWDYRLLKSDGDVDVCDLSTSCGRKARRVPARP